MVESSDARTVSVQTSASKLLAAADIWSTEAIQPAPPSSAPAAPESLAPEPIPPEQLAPVRVRPRASEIMAAFKSASSSDRHASEPTLVPATSAAGLRKLSLALQGGGSLSAFTWGVVVGVWGVPGSSTGRQRGAPPASKTPCRLSGGPPPGGGGGGARGAWGR